MAKSISGNLYNLSNQKLTLEGFNGLKTYHISSSTIDENGKFLLNYSKVDYGMGYLISSDNKTLFVILNGEYIEIIGKALSNSETIKVVKSKETLYFEHYSKEHPKRELALNSWDYLEKFCTQDSLFSIHISSSA